MQKPDGFTELELKEYYERVAILMTEQGFDACEAEHYAQRMIELTKKGLKTMPTNKQESFYLF